jgi:hypothetical protein
VGCSWSRLALGKRKGAPDRPADQRAIFTQISGSLTTVTSSWHARRPCRDGQRLLRHSGFGVAYIPREHTHDDRPSHTAP